MSTKEVSALSSALGRMLYSVNKQLTQESALVIVDLQNDFFPGGSLAVQEGDRTVSPLNSLMKSFNSKNLPVVKTRDWHPRKTDHFNHWPVHCVAGTYGAAFHPELDHGIFDIVVSKGKGDEDEYSGFDAKNDEDVSLNQILSNLDVKKLFIGGLATDYCVKSTVLDALKLGYEVVLITDAIRAVDLQPGDGEKAIAEMVAAGAVPV